MDVEKRSSMKLDIEGVRLSGDKNSPKIETYRNLGEDQDHSDGLKGINGKFFFNVFFLKILQRFFSFLNKMAEQWNDVIFNHCFKLHPFCATFFYKKKN